MVVKKIEIPWLLTVDNFEVLVYILKTVSIDSDSTKIKYQFCVPNSVIQSLFKDIVGKHLKDKAKVYIINDQPTLLKDCYPAQDFKNAIEKAKQFVKTIIDNFKLTEEEIEFINKSDQQKR